MHCNRFINAVIIPDTLTEEIVYTLWGTVFGYGTGGMINPLIFRDVFLYLAAIFFFFENLNVSILVSHEGAVYHMT